MRNRDGKLEFGPHGSCGPVRISLDTRFYGTLEQMQQHFPSGGPSMVHCNSLVIDGDIRFGKNAVLRGSVHIINRHNTTVTIADNTALEGEVIF